MAELTGLSVLIEGDASSLKASIASAVGMVDKFRKSAEDSAKVFERAFSKSDRSLDRLRRSLDPLYASSKRYESAVETLDQALKFGSITQQQHTQLLERAGKTYLTAGGQAQTAAAMTGRFGAALNNNRFIIQNTAFQIQDMAVQLAAGTRASTVFAQQGSQILSAFGPVGAVIGALAATGLPLLAIALANSTSKGKTLDDIMGDLNASAGDLDSTLRDVLTPFAELQKQFGENAARARELYDAMYAMRQIKFASELAAANEGLADSLKRVSKAVADFNEIHNAAYISAEDKVERMTVVADYLNREFGITVDQAREIARSLDLLRAAGPEDAANAATRLRIALTAAADSSGEIPAKLLDAALQAGAIEQKALVLAAAMGRSADAARAIAETDVATPIGLAAAQASGLANSLGLAVSRLYGLQKIVRGSGGTIGGGAPSKLSPNTPGWGAGRGGTGGSDGWGTAPGWTVRKSATGGGGGQNPLQGELAQLQTALATAEELEMQSWLKRQEILQQALDQRLITQAEYAALMEEAQRAHQEKMAAIDVWRYGDGAQKAAAFMGTLANAFQSGNEKMQRAAKVFASVEALINAWRAYTQTLADPSLPYFAKFAAAAQVLSAGFGAVSAIKSAGSGGGGASGSASAAAAPATAPATAFVTLTGDTFSRNQVADLFRQINEGLANGYRIRLN